MASAEERAETITDRITTDMNTTLRGAGVANLLTSGEYAALLHDLVTDAMYHVDHLLTEIEG